MNPVIFIPGIEATALANVNTFNFELVWNAFDNLGSSVSNTLLGPYIEEKLQLDPLYDENENSIIERNHIARLPYEKTILNLKRDLNANFYLFGYDWRLSNAENGKRLREYFRRLRKKLEGSRITGYRFLTHSMGAHVFLNFIRLLDESELKFIDKVILTVPPFLGSPYSLIHMIKGIGGARGFFNQLFGRNEDVRKVMRTYPSIFELLPSYPNAITFENGQNVDLTDIGNWQSNLIEKNDNGIARAMFTSRLKALRQYRKRMKTFPESIMNRTIVVAGEGEKETSVFLRVREKQGETDNFILLDQIRDGYGNGDGTVPFVSATCFSDKVLTLAVKKDDFFEEPSGFSLHGLFLRDSRVQNIIKRYFLAEEGMPVSAGATEWWNSIGGGVRMFRS